MNLKMKILKIMTVLVVMVFFSDGLLTAAADADSATAQLKTSIDKILSVMRDPVLKADDLKEVRREKLRKIAGERFDYERMSQLSLAKHWRERSDEEKAEFTQLFSTLLEDSYMSKIESYTDERVVYVNERVKKQNTKEYAKINTKIITQTAEIPIDYMMYREGNAPWRVYDMVIEGVSMVNNYRSQFGRILDRETFDALIHQLKEKKN